MTIEPRLDIIGAALADSSRSCILCELMDGRAFTDKELARAAYVGPQTASARLKQLEMTGLTTSLRSCRNVYRQIASAEVTGVLEGLASFSPTDHLPQSGNRGRTRSDTHLARSCYNHIAGRLGVQMTEHLAAVNVLKIKNEAVTTGLQFQTFLDDFGIKVRPNASGKPFVRLCLDRTERRHHISGPLATAIMRKGLQFKWLDRRTGGRTLIITADGFDVFDRWFGLPGQVLENVSDVSEIGR